MSPDIHDPDFDLAKGSRQMALTLSVDVPRLEPLDGGGELNIPRFYTNEVKKLNGQILLDLNDCTMNMSDDVMRLHQNKKV